MPDDLPGTRPFPLGPLITLLMWAVATSAAVVTQGRAAPLVLLATFIIWNVLPPVALGLAIYLYHRKGSATLRLSPPIALALAPPIIIATWYFVLWPRPAQPAAPFMIIPTLSGVVILAVFGVSYLTRKPTG